MSEQATPNQPQNDSAANPESSVSTMAIYQPQWDTWTRRVVVVLLIGAGLFAISLLGPVIQILATAFLIAFVMFAPSRALARNTPIPYGLAVVLLYLLLILLILFLILVIIPSFVSGVDSLINVIERAYADFTRALQEYQPDQGIVPILGVSVDFNVLIEPVRSFLLGEPLEPVLFVDPALQEAAGIIVPGATPTLDATGLATTGTPPAATPAPLSATPQPGALAPTDVAGPTPTPALTATAAAGETTSILQATDLREILSSLFNVAGTVTGTLTSAISSVTGLFITIILALFISFLVLLDLPEAQDAFMRHVPKAYHREYALLIARIVRVWNGFFRGQVLIGFIIGVLTWLQLSIMGVAGAEILAVFTGLVSLIPTIGGMIALIPLGLVPLIQGSSVFVNLNYGLFALLVVGVSLVINQVMWSVVAPKILGDALDLPLAVIIVGVFIGTAVGGVLGAFLVAPILATARVALAYVLDKLGGQDPFPGEEVPEALTEGLFTYVRQKSQLKPKPPAP